MRVGCTACHVSLVPSSYFIVFISVKSSRFSLGTFSFVVSQSINQSINQSIDRSINQSINRSINQSIDQSINQSIDQSIN